MFASIKTMARDEEGASMVEYGLMIALIALIALVAVQAIGTNLSTVFNRVATPH